MTLLPNVLLTYTLPDDVVVRQALPPLGDLRCPTQRGRIQVAEDLETDFSRKDGKGVDADEVGELLGQQGELGEAAHGEEALEDEGPAGMRRGREI